MSPSKRERLSTTGRDQAELKKIEKGHAVMSPSSLQPLSSLQSAEALSEAQALSLVDKSHGVTPIAPQSILLFDQLRLMRSGELNNLKEQVKHGLVTLTEGEEKLLRWALIDSLNMPAPLAEQLLPALRELVDEDPNLRAQLHTLFGPLSTSK